MSEFVTFLGNGDYKILQDDAGYLFSADSVLLANLSRIGSKDKVLDLGTGCGIIATLIAVKKGAESVLGIELDAKTADMAARSISMNKLNDKVAVKVGDVKNIRSLVTAGEYDKVVCNPPYFDPNDGTVNAGIKAQSKKQTEGGLSDFVSAAAFALKNGGDFSLIYPSASLADLMVALRSNGLEPKHLILIYPKLSKGLDTVIVFAKKGGKVGLTTETLVLMDEDGRYTPRVKELYS